MLPTAAAGDDREISCRRIRAVPTNSLRKRTRQRRPSHIGQVRIFDGLQQLMELMSVALSENSNKPAFSRTSGAIMPYSFAANRIPISLLDRHATRHRRFAIPPSDSSNSAGTSSADFTLSLAPVWLRSTIAQGFCTVPSPLASTE
jgi:hypothetical protein